MSSSPSSPHSRPASALVGQLAESFVAAWLINRGWTLIQRRWRCRWGELDLVMERSPRSEPLTQPPILAFVEVKARRRGSWDQDGLLALTPQKQAKLWQAAQLFLGTFPQMAHHTCRFDVALVRCHLQFPGGMEDRDRAQPLESLMLPPTLQLGQSILIHPYQLTLQQYLPGAFDQPEG